MLTKKMLVLAVVAVAVALTATYFALQQGEGPSCKVLVADIGTGVSALVLDPSYKVRVGDVEVMPCLNCTEAKFVPVARPVRVSVIRGGEEVFAAIKLPLETGMRTCGCKVVMYVCVRGNKVVAW